MSVCQMDDSPWCSPGTCVHCDKAREPSRGYCDKPAHDNYNELVEEVERLRADLTQKRLDHMHSEAIREALVHQAVDTAGDMVRVLTLLEAAFHAGFLDEHSANASEGFRAWSKENIK